MKKVLVILGVLVGLIVVAVIVLQSAAPPILGLFAETKNLLARGACEPFYKGTVAHPK